MACDPDANESPGHRPRKPAPRASPFDNHLCRQGRRLCPPLEDLKGELIRIDVGQALTVEYEGAAVQETALREICSHDLVSHGGLRPAMLEWHRRGLGQYSRSIRDSSC